MRRRTQDISGEVIAITGGARGIGAATAHALHAAGARVAIGDLDPAPTSGLLSVALDVTDHAGFTAFLDEVERKLGPLDVLINNAGIMAVTEFDQETPESISRQLEINLHAVLHGSQQAVRRMTPQLS